MKTYDAVLQRVVDGDTVDVDIHLGFSVVLHKQRIRIMGIDAPESRTSDQTEKIFGLAAKNKVKELLTSELQLVVQDDKTEKFGRILGDFRIGDRLLTEILVEEGYAVAYEGGDKTELTHKHLQNREKLIQSGKVKIST